jgi:hypothetical protein
MPAVGCGEHKLAERRAALEGVGTVLMVFPKVLSDPEWKKTEKAGGVSATGVGQTLREVETLYKKLDAGIEAAKQHNTDAKQAKPAKDATVAAIEKSVKTLDAVITKVKDAKKKQIITDFRFKLNRFGSELKNLDLVDHRGLEWAVGNYNDRVKMGLK